MGVDLWAELGGEELVNATRLAAYVRAGYKPRTATITVDGCPGLATALSCLTDAAGAPVPVSYTRPDDPADPAPWYDPLDPPSADFAGLLVTSVEGAETAPFTRQVTPLVGDGAVLGSPAYGPRVLEITALLIGRTCCSLQAGLRWLNGVLRSACDPGGAELSYLECCPNETTTAAVGVAPFLRSMRRVGVSDGVKVTNRVGPSCGLCASGCTYMEVQFTLTAGDPFSYGPAVLALDDLILAGGYSECVTWNVPRRKVEIAPGKFRIVESDCATGGCGQGDCPSQDPRCPVSPLPPSFPAPDPCGCDPLVTVGGFGYIAPGVAPAWQQMVPVVTLSSGANPLRGIRVKLYSNPTQRPVADLDECDVCADFAVSYLQPGTSFTVDGRDRRFYLTCPGGERSPGDPLVSGSSGRPFRWPVLDCGGGYSVSVTADAATAADDAAYRVELVPRTPA